MNDKDVEEYIRDLWKEDSGETTERDRSMIARSIRGFWAHLKTMPDYISEDDMCINCVTPWKCNGPHIPANEPEAPVNPVMVTITVNAIETSVPAHSYLDYDAIVVLAYGKTEPYMTVVFSSDEASGSLWQGGPVVKPAEKMRFTACHTGGA